MNFRELQDKIGHARRLSHDFLPKIPIADFCELINVCKDRKSSCLTYIDENDDCTELNYQDFCDAVFGVARFMQKHGLSHGDRIATASHNHWQTVVQYYAAWLLGLVVVPINLNTNDEHITYILEKSNIEMIFVRVDYRQRIKNILEKHDTLKNIEGVLCEDTLDNYSIHDGELKLAEESLAESEALVIFKKGSTGRPKGVVLSQRNLLEDARAIKQWNHINEQTRMMCVLPIHDVNGIVVTLITPFFRGSSVVLNRHFKAARFFPVINEEQVHIVSVTPAILKQLNSHYKNKKRPEVATLKHLICGSEPLTVEVIETFEEQLNVRVIYGYGLPETTCCSCFIPLDIDEEAHKKWRSEYDYPSIGVDIAANEMEIHDENGDPLDENERGEIVIRGVNIMMGYDNDKEADEAAFKNGWFHTGDEGFFVRGEINRKFFFVTGQLKD